MHTERERKWLAWAETSRLIPLLESAALDGQTDFYGNKRPNFEVGPFAREMAFHMGTVVLPGWIAKQGWRGDSGPVRWIDTDRREPEEVAAAIGELWRMWIKGETPAFCQIVQAKNYEGKQYVIDKFGVTVRGEI